MTRGLRNVLVVDDEPHVLRVAELCLQTLGGFNVTVAGGGREALAKAATTTPDIILLDVMMPEMDGPTTLTALRTLTMLDAVPVVFLTARVRHNEVLDYFALGADGLIAKPFEAATLCQQVADVWSRFHAVAD